MNPDSMLVRPSESSVHHGETLWQCQSSVSHRLTVYPPVLRLPYIGFFIGGFPIVVVARALSHLVFVIVGMSLIKNKESITIKGSLGSSFIIGMIHGICEVLVVIPFYFNSSLSPAYYDKGFLQGVILLVGVGTVIHSMLDVSLSVYIWNLLPKGFVNKIGKEENLGIVQKVKYILDFF